MTPMNKRVYIQPKIKVAEIDPEYNIADGYITGSYEKDQTKGAGWGEEEDDI